jgi:DNA-binding LacI/PurR family transcriptional regulator
VTEDKVGRPFTGRYVPDDPSDGRHTVRVGRAPLSTVRQPLVELGREMAEMLLRHVDADERVTGRLVLPVELIVRDSTARAIG